MLVDDDPICNLLAQKFLERIETPKQIQIAINGAQAIGLLNVFVPDIILLDLNMPVMDGFQFIEAFNKLDFDNKRSVKIIIVSSSKNSIDVEHARGLGVDEFIVKPVSVEKLQSVI